MSLPAKYKVGHWTVIPLRCQLQNGSEVRHIEPKAMQLLEVLAAKAGEVVTRGDLQDEIWPKVVVSDHALTRLISQLRAAIDDPDAPESLIETIPKVGYRLIEEVDRSEPPDSAKGSTEEQGTFTGYGFRFEPRKHLLTAADGHSRNLAPDEAKVLERLEEAQPGLISESDLLAAIRADTDAEGKVYLGEIIAQIRQHFEVLDAGLGSIQFMPGQGYRLGVSMALVSSGRDLQRQGAQKRLLSAAVVVIIAAVAGMIFYFPSIPVSVPWKQAEAQPLINTAAYESRPSVVADLLAYATATAAGDSNVMVVSLIDGATIATFASDDFESFPSLSPAGDRLAYVSRQRAEGSCSIVVANLLVASAERRHDCPAVPILTLAWGPDSKSLVYPGEEGIMELALDSGLSRLIVPAVGEARFIKPQFISEREIAFIAFDYNNNESAIEVFDRTSGSTTVLHQSNHWLSDFFYTEGAWVLASVRPGDSGIWRMVGGVEEKLGSYPAQDVAVYGDSIIFTHALGDVDICLARRNSAVNWDCATALSSTAMDANPSFLTDQLMGFHSYRSGKPRYYLFNLLTQSIIPPVDGIGLTGSVIALNGQTLVYSEQDALVFWNISTASGTQRIPVDHLHEVIGAIGGRYLIFNTTQRKLEVLDLATRAKKTLSEKLPLRLRFNRHNRMLESLNWGETGRQNVMRWRIQGEEMDAFSLEPVLGFEVEPTDIARSGEWFLRHDLARSSQILSMNGDLIVEMQNEDMIARRLNFIATDDWFAREKIAKFSTDIYMLPFSH